MKKVIKAVLSFLLFAAFVAALYFGLKRANILFMHKDSGMLQYNFGNLERDTLETVFVGNSHQFCSIDTEILANEYGINSFMLASSAQTIAMSYYAAMEAIELQHPDRIVLEVFYTPNELKAVSDATLHEFLDGMPSCKAKKLALRDLVEEKDERIYYALGIGAYHTRWKELSENDFDDEFGRPHGNHHEDRVEPNTELTVVDPSEKMEMPEETLEYFDKIVDLCQSRDVELVCYVAPFNAILPDDANSSAMFLNWLRTYNWLSDHLSERGIVLRNLMYELDGIGLDLSNDFLDSQHLNCYGQAKVTRYMAEKGYLGGA